MYIRNIEDNLNNKIVLFFECMLSHFSHGLVFATLRIVAHQAPLFLGFSRKKTRVGCHVLFQGIFPIQGSDLCLLCLLHWRVGSLSLVPFRKLSNPSQLSKLVFYTVFSLSMNFYPIPIIPTNKSKISLCYRLPKYACTYQ